MVRLLVVVTALLSFAVSGSKAQDASPAAGRDVPDAAECVVEPRAEDELRALFQEVVATPAADAASTASPTPAAPPPGDPADMQTVAEINATWRQFIACFNAGDRLRILALFSDNRVQASFAFHAASRAPEDQLIVYLMATPVALPSGAVAPFVALHDMRVLDDERVAAIRPGETGPGEVLIFVKDGDRWLVDEQFDLTQDGTPDDGTPTN